METTNIQVKHGKGDMVSYGLGGFGREFLKMAFDTYVFFYYETEIGLNVWWIGLALIIFAIYNAINDPLIGYLTNREFKFTKKYGRRMPLILLGGIPMGLCYFLMFTPPNVNPTSGALTLFFWLLIIAVLYDTFHSLFFVNYQSLFPDKFRSSEERRSVTSITVPLGVIGVALGAILPPMFIKYENLETYAIQGVVAFIFCVLMMILSIPGIREDPEMTKQYLKKNKKREEERDTFLESLKKALKQQSFVVFIILYTAYCATTVSMTSSISYVVRFILQLEANATTLLMAGMLVGTLVSSPFWVKYAKKTDNNRRVMIIASLLMSVLTIPFIFLENYILLIIAISIWGVSLGAFWVMLFPVMSDIIDESIVNHKEREEGTYTGIQQFFGRLGSIVQVLSFAIIHEFTGFVEGSATQTELALWGIHMHLAVVPMFSMLIGGLIFWKFYDLTPDRTQFNQKQIEKLNL
ncbi:MAG: MFS transporter [Promethearchaeia archaeon]